MDHRIEDRVFWGVAGRGAVELGRVAVDLGLRSALLAYGDMSVPGIAGTWFVRQLVWPCLALAVEAEMPGWRGAVPKARFATAIEALACKLHIEADPTSSSETRMGRVAGTRSLPMKGWGFEELGTPRGFVSNPNRRGATRALPEVGGLGFTEGAQRLQGMGLTALGLDLVRPVLDAPVGRGTVRSWLGKWPHGIEEPSKKVRAQLGAAIGPFDPTARERHAVMVAMARAECDDGRRKRLIDLLAKRPSRHALDVDGDVLRRLPARQAEEIRAAWAFRTLLTAAQRLLRAVASRLPSPGTTRTIDAFLVDGGDPVAERTRLAARTFIDRLEDRPELGHRDAVAFALTLAGGDLRMAVAEVARRAERLLRLDGDVLAQGPGWSAGWLDDHEILDPESGAGVADDLPPRFKGLIGLLGDCGAIRG